MKSNLPLSSQIESMLFYKSEPVTIKDLAKILDQKETDIHSGIADLAESLQNRGIMLVHSGDTVSLATHAETSQLIEQLRKEELSGPLTKQALETLAIIAYRPGVTKPDIDYIRGVNSQYTLRNLLARGLIEKHAHPQDKRTHTFLLSTDCLQYLGITSVQQLPHFEETQNALHARESLKEAESTSFTS